MNSRLRLITSASSMLVALSATAAIAAPVEYAQGLKRVSEMPHGDAAVGSARGEERADMKPVAKLPLTEPEKTESTEADQNTLAGQGPSESLEQQSDTTANTPNDQPTAMEKPVDGQKPAVPDLSISPFKDKREMEASAFGADTSPFTLLPASLPMNISIIAVGGETALFLKQGESVVVVFSITNDLKSKVASGALTVAEAQGIDADLAATQGRYYDVPRDSRDLKAALGFSPDAESSLSDLRELLAVHIQTSLGTSVKTSSYLADVAWYLTANHN